LNGFDVVVAILILVGAYRGYKGGFLAEIISLVAIVLGFLAAFRFAGEATALFTGSEASDNKNLPYITFVIIFVLVAGIISWLGKRLRGSVEESFFGSIDQAFGAALGALIADYFIGRDVANFKESVSYPYLEAITGHIIAWINTIVPEVRDVF
jgi:membrane protein required for colicin V production